MAPAIWRDLAAAVALGQVLAAAGGPEPWQVSQTS